MENSGYVSFLEIWYVIMMGAAFLFVAGGIIVYIAHKLKASSIKDFKGKHDYLNQFEIKNYKTSYLFFGIALGCLMTTYGDETVAKSIAWFFVRLFIAGSAGTLFGYVASLIVTYYYPGKLQKKLDYLRYTPRTNTKTGNKMKLLSEEEEDVHLDEGMQAEEDVFSVDYDVWIDEATGDTKIEKYAGYMEALKCGTCGFQTLKIAREEIVVPATNETDGELLKHYECSYCGSRRTTAHKIIKSESPVPSQIHQAMEVETAPVPSKQMIRLQFYDNSGINKSYEFQGVDQVKKFLEEYERDNS